MPNLNLRNKISANSFCISCKVDGGNRGNGPPTSTPLSSHSAQTKLSEEIYHVSLSEVDDK